MDRMLVDILKDQRNLGNKNDGGWKSKAYNTATSALSTQFKVSILGDNVKHHIKLWKNGMELATGHGAETVIEANDIMSSELKDEKNSEKCEVNCLSNVQGLDELNVESKSGASLPIHVQRKRSQSITSSTTPSKKKKIGDKDKLAIVVGKIAESFREYIRSS
ncbi:hypothetical protein CRYUN_Cryun04dG0155700 [Craigia yunnanensis]